MDPLVRVLFVCMGNICRSPLAEGIFTRLVENADLTLKILTDSAATHGYHIGHSPDKRSQLIAQVNGIDIGHQRGRQVELVDFEAFDYILAMDKANLAYLKTVCPPKKQHKISLLLAFAPHLKEQEVPDPYYGGPEGFEHIYHLIEQACQGLLKHICQQEGWPLPTYVS